MLELLHGGADRGIEIQRDHLRAFAAQTQRDGAPDAIGGSRDDGQPALVAAAAGLRGHGQSVGLKPAESITRRHLAASAATVSRKASDEPPTTT